tara:strand:- start:564 stop:833 length:270 start_codon:yes stop_codon:yes gene_type:complete
VVVQIKFLFSFYSCIYADNPISPVLFIRLKTSDTYINSHANALLEHGFQQGDTIALWLPDIAEKHITLLAAAKMGLKVVDFSPSVSDVS